jgi:hypothetical protein
MGRWGARGARGARLSRTAHFCCRWSSGATGPDDHRHTPPPRAARPGPHGKELKAPTATHAATSWRPSPGGAWCCCAVRSSANGPAPSGHTVHDRRDRGLRSPTWKLDPCDQPARTVRLLGRPRRIVALHDRELVPSSLTTSCTMPIARSDTCSPCTACTVVRKSRALARASAISALPSNAAPALIRRSASRSGPHFGQQHPWNRLTPEAPSSAHPAYRRNTTARADARGHGGA